MQWSKAYAGPVGTYLLGRATRKGKSFRSNAARNYRAVVKHLKDTERKILELEDAGEDFPTFGMDDIYWAVDIDEERQHCSEITDRISKIPV